MSDKLSWHFARGHEIAPGRTALRALGGGNRCQVYLVWDESLRRRLVAKVLRRNLVGDDHSVRALARELDALDELAHPGLARAVGAQLDGPYPHIAVEYVEGPTLRRSIKEGGPLAAGAALRVGADVASVLAHVAAKGWVHLDVKPGNIVMGASPRVIDLSLARRAERARRLTRPVGTNAYMAPEQCHPRGDVGPRTDVWGLGATLYHALTGRRPFRKPVTRAEDAPLEERFPQLKDRPFPLTAPLPALVEETVLACLERDPSRRPDAAELADLLRAASLVPDGTRRVART